MRLSGAPDTPDTAQKAFSRARREALLRRAWARARGAPGSVALESIEEAKSAVGGVDRVPIGLESVRLRDIVGSVARRGDFDSLFLPLKRELGPRWQEIYRRFQRQEALGFGGPPPVKLYKVGRRYFVRDGNHRVSVARFRGWETIEAEVVLISASSRPHAG